MTNASGFMRLHGSVRIVSQPETICCMRLVQKLDTQRDILSKPCSLTDLDNMLKPVEMVDIDHALGYVSPGRAWLVVHPEDAEHAATLIKARSVSLGALSPVLQLATADLKRIRWHVADEMPDDAEAIPLEIVSITRAGEPDTGTSAPMSALSTMKGKPLYPFKGRPAQAKRTGRRRKVKAIGKA